MRASLIITFVHGIHGLIFFQSDTVIVCNMNVDSQCIMIDSVLNLDEPVDILILHRVMNLYGTADIIEKCKEAIVC